MSVGFGQPVAALSLTVPFAVVSSMLSSASSGALLTRIGLGRILTGSHGLYAVALLAQSLAPAFWVFIVAAVALAAGSGAIDAALNAYAARQFNARQITWLHAVYGLGSGPLLFVATAAAGLLWRSAFALVAAMLGVPTVVFAFTVRLWQTPQQPRPRASEEPRTRSKVRLPAAIWSGAAGRCRPEWSPPPRSRRICFSPMHAPPRLVWPPQWHRDTGSPSSSAVSCWGRWPRASVRARCWWAAWPGWALLRRCCLAWTRARRWHRVAGAFRRTDVPTADPHHEGRSRAPLGQTAPSVCRAQLRLRDQRPYRR
jgi:MFS family permease